MRNRNFTDLSNCSLGDLLDIDKIQTLQDALSNAFGLGITMTDANHNKITKDSNGVNFCIDVVRSSEEGRSLCKMSDDIISSRHDDGPVIVTCKAAGLMDAGASIIVGGVHMGSWLVGQVMDIDNEPTEEQLRKRAVELKVDPDAYVAESKKLPRMTREQFKKIADALFIMANHVANVGMINYTMNNELQYRRELERLLEHRNEHDTLTNLYNRYYYEKKVTELILAEACPVSVIVMDANFLKLSNDFFGHSEGDCLLQLISGALVEEAKDNYYICRCGGDEFYVIMENSDETEAESYVRRVRERSLEDYCTVLPPSFACGYATKKTRDENLISVIKQAEDRMYVEKTDMKRSGAILDILRKRLFSTGYVNESDMRYCREITMAFSKYIKLPAAEKDILDKILSLQYLGMISVPLDMLESADENIDAEIEAKYNAAITCYRIAMMFDKTSSAARYVLQLNEEWNGSGKPDGLKGDEISLPARIWAVVNFYTTLIGRKPHGYAFSRDEAVNALRRRSGKSFDPELVEKFIEFINR